MLLGNCSVRNLLHLNVL